MAVGMIHGNGGPPNSPPLLPRFHVERTRLLDILDAYCKMPITVVIAPAGSGKTVLLSSWVHTRQPDAVWITCDTWTKEQFWIEVVHALRRARPDRWVDAADIADETPVDLHALLAAIIADLPQSSSPLTLVIDDLQHVGDVGPFIERLANSLPDESRIVIGSRSENALGVSRMRAQGILHEVRERDLRLSNDDTVELLERLGAHVPETIAISLAERTEGWAVGIQIAGIALRSSTDPVKFVESFTGAAQEISDVMLHDVIDHLSPDTKEFLRLTSVIDSLSPGPCEAVTRVDDAGRVLRDLHASGLFIMTGEQPGTYRYHSLFRDVLLQEFKQQAPKKVKQTHLRVAQWYSENGFIDLAIAHFRDADQRDLALALFNEHLNAEFARDGIAAPQRFVQALTGGLVRIPAEFLVPVAWTLAAAGAIDEAQVWIDRARRQLDVLTNIEKDRLVICRGLVELLSGETDAVTETFQELRNPSAKDPIVRTHQLHLAYLAMWNGDLPLARQLLQIVATSQKDPFVVEVIVGGVQSWLSYLEGDLQEAERLSTRAIALAASENAGDHPDLVDALRTRGLLLYKRGNFEEAESHLERSITIGERTRPPLAFLSGLELARIWLLLGRIEDARMVVQSARDLLRSKTGILIALATQLEAEISLAIGDTSASKALLLQLPDNAYRSILAARVSLVDGQPDLALQTLNNSRDTTPREALTILALQARAAHDIGLPEVDSFLRECLSRAEESGSLHVFMDNEFLPLTLRLRAILSQAQMSDFQRSALRALEQRVPVAKQTLNAGVEQLTQREITVLRYLASRYTVSEIAQELFVSINTLKTHTKAIYRKLGVSSRQEAIAEARRLKIL